MSNRRAQDERIEGTPDGVNAITAIMDLPDAPTIGTATAGLGSVSVAFTPATTGGTATLFTATSNPGSITGTSATSPITVSGLTGGTAYTFTVIGSNSTGTGPSSSASNSVTPVDLTGAYDALASVTLSAATASIDFAGIPTGYKHLQLRIISRSDYGPSELDSLAIRLNSDSNSNYAYHWLSGNGATATAGGAASQTAGILGIEPSNGHTSGIFGAYIVDFLDYANTNKTKTIRSLGGVETNNTGTEVGQIRLASTLWNSTNAITTISLKSGGGFSRGFIENSQFALYGVK